MSGIPHFVRKTRITTTPTQLMLAVLSYAMKLNSVKSKALAHKTTCKTVAWVSWGIRWNFNVQPCLTGIES